MDCFCKSTAKLQIRKHPGGFFFFLFLSRQRNLVFIKCFAILAIALLKIYCLCSLILLNYLSKFQNKNAPGLVNLRNIGKANFPLLRLLF